MRRAESPLSQTHQLGRHVEVGRNERYFGARVEEEFFEVLVIEPLVKPLRQ